MDNNSEFKKTIELLNPWHQGKKIDTGIIRPKYISKITSRLLHQKQILFLIGSRRVGKTMLMFQYIYKLIQQGTNPKKIIFLSLDNINLTNLNLYKYLTENKFDYIFLDEVQYYPDWAQVLKSIYDIKTFQAKIICSGSSGKLIEKNRNFITGRNTTIIVKPLSFVEFKKFNKDHSIEDYLYYGGYPEYVIEKQPNYLSELLQDIIEKDILKQYQIQNIENLFNISKILAKNIGYRASSNKIAKTLNIDNKTADKYINYLREVKLVEKITQYSENINERIYSQKKIYFNDLGMRNSIVGYTDIGSLVENAVFIRLAEIFDVTKIYYLLFTKEQEVDFLVEIDSKNVIFIESKFKDSKEGVVNSVSRGFLKDLHNKIIKRRIVITNDVSAEEIINGKKVELIPLQRFLEINL